VASLVGNFSPVKSRRAILVRRTRHFRGDTGDVLNTRAIVEDVSVFGIVTGPFWRNADLLEIRSSGRP
jgi:hypothetical protein